MVPSAAVSVGGTREATCGGFETRGAAGGGGTLDLGRGLLTVAFLGAVGGGGTARLNFVVADVFGAGGGAAFLTAGGGTAFATLGGLALGSAGAAGMTGGFGGGGATRAVAFGTAGFGRGGATTVRFGTGGGVAGFDAGRIFCGAGFATLGEGGTTVFRGLGIAATVGRLTGVTVGLGGGGAFALCTGLAVRDVNPCGKVSCDFGGCAGGGSSPPVTLGVAVAAGAVGPRPERSIPGNVGSGPSFSSTPKSTITLGRLEPGGKTYCCCALAGITAASNVPAVSHIRHDRIPRNRPKFRTRFSKMEAYSFSIFSHDPHP